jgi:UDP:flavonoid glycosyltransferase YjiC (YdhE family)
MGTLPYRALVNVGDYMDQYESVPPNVIIDKWFPQPSVIPQVDAVIHHGGNNSFTECLRAGVPALVLPFSSDQFAVAADAERAGAALVRDPNALLPADVPTALTGLRRAIGPRMPVRARALRGRGPRWGAARLVEAMSERAPAR